MTISDKEIENIANLAALGLEQNEQVLKNDITMIMDYVEQLRSIDTNKIAPLYHPFDLFQRIRPDKVTEQNCIDELEEIAPLFEDGMYLVPKVIESEKE